MAEPEFHKILKQLTLSTCALFSELFQESKPATGKNGLLDLMQGLRATFAGAPISEDEKQFLAQFRDDFQTRVYRPLDDVIPTETPAEIASVVRKCRDNCLDLCDRLRNEKKKRGIADDNSEEPTGTDFDYERAILVYDLGRFTQRVRISASAFPAANIPACIRLIMQQIGTIVDEAIGRTSVKLDSALITPLGDGSVLQFPTMIDALTFAHRLHFIAEERNDVPHPDPNAWQNHFRIGICFGHVQLTPVRNAELPRTDTCGLPFIYATRLCSGCRTGEVLISEHAWGRLQQEPKEPKEPILPTHFLNFN